LCRTEQEIVLSDIPREVKPMEAVIDADKEEKPSRIILSENGFYRRVKICLFLIN